MAMGTSTKSAAIRMHITPRKIIDSRTLMDIAITSATISVTGARVQTIMII